MKKLLTIILLISHVNFSMFIAQVDEQDTYDKYGQQKEDINSLVQYVAQICHIKHKPLKDNDDDNARYFHVTTLEHSLFKEHESALNNSYNNSAGKRNYAPYLQNKISSIIFDIQSPPPEV